MEKIGFSRVILASSWSSAKPENQLMIDFFPHALPLTIG